METRMVDMAIGQVLAISVIVLGTGELIAAIAGGQSFSNFIFGIFGWVLGVGAWREHQTRKRSPGAMQTWEAAEFWISVAAAIGVALWGTFSFAMPAFPVLTSGKGFESHSLGYLAKMFSLWFAILAFGAGLFVMGGRQKVFSLASWTYILACGVLLLFFTPFSEGVGHVLAYAEREPQVLLGNIPPGQPAPNVANQPPAANPNCDKSARSGSAIEPCSSNRTTAAGRARNRSRNRSLRRRSSSRLKSRCRKLRGRLPPILTRIRKSGPTYVSRRYRCHRRPIWRGRKRSVRRWQC